MKIALVGYGKMGKEIEKIAIVRGHQVVIRVDPLQGESFSSPGFMDADVIIEFTMPKAALDNYRECFKRNKPVVSGTTGWLEHIDEVKDWCLNKGQTFFHSSNFSIGVNIFFELNRHLARLMNPQANYDVSITEVHHLQKIDAPSGTSITLLEDIISNLDRKTKWMLDGEPDCSTIPVTAKREGLVPGIHTIKYESEEDEIIIHHSAKSRQGFALGAVLAAEFTHGKTGFLTMKDMLKF